MSKTTKDYCCRVLVLVSSAFATSDAPGELIVNGGFENGLNNWIWTGDGVNDVASLSNDTPSGVGSSADLDINQGNGLPWLIQDVPVNAGDQLMFSAWVREVEPNSPNDAWIAAQVWMLPDSASGTILTSAALFFTNPNWEMQSTQIAVPAGATIARVLFTPQNPSFGVGTGQYRIDDVSLIIPEPASSLLVGISLAAAIWQLRRNLRRPLTAHAKVAG